MKTNTAFRSTSNWLIAWLPVWLLTAAVLALAPNSWPRWAWMWSLVGAIYSGLKWLSWWGTPTHSAPAWKHIAYLLLWPGMGAAAFLNPRTRLPRPTPGEWCFAAVKTVLGVAILWGLVRCVREEWPYVVGWVGMVGMIMIAHFGSFHLLSCAWRSGGVAAKPLMNWPLLATSVSDYWGRRWNTAFPDLTHRFMFRPLEPVVGAGAAIFTVFFFSGLVHDLVISLPPHGGYGGPTAFFLVQALAMLFERSPEARRLGLRSGWRGWLFTAFVILGPAALLFHPPFVLGIVVPFMRALGAIP